MSTLFSGVFRALRCLHLASWCVHSVARVRLVCLCVESVPVCPPCFLVCSERRSVSVLFSGAFRVSRVSALFSGVSEYRNVSTFLSGVSIVSRCVRHVFWLVQSVAVCPPCFLVCLKCHGMSVLFSGVSRVSRVSALFSGVSEYRDVSTFLSGVSRVSR